MNICILSHRYPYKDNMVHVFVKKLVDEWARMGHNCVVISPISMIHVLMRKEIICPKIDQYDVGDGKFVTVYRPHYYAIPKLQVFGVSVSEYIRQHCVEKTIRKTGLKFDAIYCHFYVMVTAAWHYASQNNIPLFVATGESTTSAISKPCKSFTIAKMREDLCGVVAVSSKNKNEAVALGYASEHNIKVFPNAANLELFKLLNKHECRKELGLPVDKFIIICVGQFVERKGQNRILHALNLLHNNDIKTVFVGKGEDQFEHDSILFKGTIKNTELPRYLNAADVFVLPTRNEGCCNAIIEALACGLPIISSDKPFNYDVLNEGNSILIDPEDVNAIARAIDKLYRDEKLRISMAKKSYEMGQKLSIKERASNIIVFMQKMIQERVQQ